MWGCDLGGPVTYSLIGILVNILMVVTIIYIVVLTIRSMLDKNKKTSNDIDPLETLRQRYVRGELSEEEYLRMKDILLS